MIYVAQNSVYIFGLFPWIINKIYCSKHGWINYILLLKKYVSKQALNTSVENM